MPQDNPGHEKERHQDNPVRLEARPQGNYGGEFMKKIDTDNIPEGYCQCGCGEKTNFNHGIQRRYIHGHYWKANPPKWNGGKKIIFDRVLIYCPGHPKAGNYGYVKESHLIVEKVMGKPLPPDAQVHHIDLNPLNNAHNNLVVAENNEYHALLHIRQRALKECGHANWRKCQFCKQYDDPKNMTTYKRYGRKGGTKSFHMKCRLDYDKERMKAKGHKID
jgi:hypothetical protein